MPRLRRGAVKDYFLNYDETLSNDFVLENGGRDVELFTTDIADWRITFVDTGLNSPSASGCCGSARFVEGEEMFLANYADILTDAPLPDMIERFRVQRRGGQPARGAAQSSHHVVDIDDDGLITRVTPVRD